MRVRLQAPVLCAIAVVAAMAGPAPGQEPGPDGPALVVAGGPAAVSDTVVEALESATDTGSARLAGPNRYATAAAVADTFPTGSPAFIAWGEGPADALAGGPAAAVAGGPVLLTRTDELPEETVAALERLAPSSITVLGGTAVVAEPVEAALAELTDGEVTRLAGPDRYATAAAIARTFPAPVDGVFIASGESFADALSAAQAAGLAGVPVLLTTTHEVPAPTTEALQALAPGALTVVGGTAAIADSVVLQLEDATGVVATRLAGDSRFTTALAVARATYPEGAQRVYLADGGDFPDALAVSPLAAGGAGAAPAFAGADPDQGDGPLVLVTDPLPDVVRDGVVELLGGTVDPAEDNEPPTADDQAVTVAAGGTVAITLTGSDPDGDPLTFAITTEPNRGTVALAGDVATYEAAGGGYTTTFTYTADDGELTSDPATVTVTVAPSAPGNRAPVVDLDPADTATVDVDAGTFTEGDAPLVLAATGTADDPDSAALASVTATLDAVVDAGAEVLAADTAGTTLTATYDPGTGELVLAPAAPATTAPEAEFTTVLQRLTYSHTGEAPTDGPRAVAVVATDAGGAASPAAEATVTVAAVNDPPTVTVPGPVTTDEDTPVAVPGISVADVDGDQVTATLTVTSGTVTTTPAGTGDGTASTVLTGTVADVNAALGTATFAPTADASGAVTMTVDVDDLGNTGTGGAGTDSDTVAITVTAVNDAPVVTVPAAASTDEDTTLTLSGVSVADVDAGGATVELELVVTGGTLSAAAGGGVNVAGSGSGTITLAGSIANLNGFASGGNVTFQPPADDDTAVTLTATADDLGNTGAGGAQTDVGTITIDLLPVNDPPVVATSGGATAFTEDGGPVAVDAALAVTDVDSTQLTGATVAITTDHVAADDVLAVTGAAGITGVYDAPTGVLTLTGAADVGDYQAVLQSVTYDNTSEDPAPATRTISVQVDDGTAPSATATKGIALNAVNDPPVVTTTGTPLALAEGDPATVVDPGVTVTDVDDTDLDGATVSISTGFDAGDVLGFTDTATITGTYTAGTGMLALTGTASLADYQAALRSITFSGTDTSPTTAKVVSFVVDDGTDPSAAATRDITVTDLNDPPVAVDDTVDVIGNTGLFVGTTRPAVEAGWVVTGSLLDNDTDAENDPLFVEPVTNGTTTLGGTITIAADGTFTYHPDASSTGVTDTIAYRVCDSDPCSSAVPNDTGQLSLPVAGLVWYVDNSAAPGGDGTSDSPFDTLAAGDAASTAGDTLFVHAGTGDATGLGGGVVLETGERLLGQAVALTLDPDGPGGPDPVVTLLPATANAHPRLTASGTDVVTLATVNVVSGVQLDPDGAGSGIAGGATAGSAVIEQVRVIDAGTPGTQPAVELSGTSGQVVLTDVVVETPATGVRANGANTVRFDSGVRITSTGSVGLHVSGTNLASSSVEAVSVSGSSAGGVVLTSNTGSISFGDLALVTTGTTPGFSATGGGTVAVPAGGTATVDATGGPALVVDSTAIGAADLTFDRLSSNGATNGIRLDSTGTSGRLVVEGTPDGTRDGSGGLITNTTGDGVVLTSTLGPTLRDLDITNAGDQGGEHAVQVTNVTGTATIDEARITDPANDGVVITSTAGTMNLDITESEVRHTTPGRPFSDDGIVVEPAGSATTTVAISDVTFTDLVGHAVRSVPTSTGLTTLTLTDSTSTVSTAGRVGGVTVNGQGVASTAITIDGNTFTDARGTAVVSVDANDTSIITGSVSDNDITRPARAGIEVIADEGGSATVTVDDNTVTDAGSDGIILVSYAGMGLSTLDARVTNNTVNGHNLDPGQAFVGGIVVFGFEDAVDLRLTGNTVTGTPGGGACGGISCVDVHLEEAGATFRMEEVPESTATPNADPAYVISVNPGVADVAVFGTIPLSNGAVITG